MAHLSVEDAQAVLGAPDVIRVSPVVSSYEVVKNGDASVQVELTGIAPTYLDVRNMKVSKGRVFTDAEVERTGRVAVLGARTAMKLFGKKDPVDATVKINQIAFTVVGVLENKGSQGFTDDSNVVLMPYTTLQRELAGRHSYLGSLCVQGASTPRMRAAEDQTRLVLRAQHHLGPKDKDDFAVFNQGRLLETENKAMGMFAIVLGGIGGIGLLTGGIGIMNIMLVIVTERTREIGVRKALGARKRDILRQFLLESVLISVLGGVIGICGGMGLSSVIKHLTSLRTVVSPGSILLSLAFATAIGIFFGFYPALRAARLHPIEALARE